MASGSSIAGFFIRDCMGGSPEDEVSVLHTDDDPRTENVTDGTNAAGIVSTPPLVT
jgi:hypothetical protein